MLVITVLWGVCQLKKTYDDKKKGSAENAGPTGPQYTDGKH